MARPLLDVHEPDDRTEVAVRETRVTRATASVLAAALSALIIATLVVNRSSAALDSDGTVSSGELGAGTVELSDDDDGRSLFDLTDMAPGRPVVRCVEVVYGGTITPVDLSLRAEATGELTRFLDVTIESGAGGGFDDCSGFKSTDRVYGNTLDRLAAAGWISLGRILNSGATITYRITFELRDDASAVGLTASSSFLWEVTPS